jgi:Domain of unknown function (DUF5127)
MLYRCIQTSAGVRAIATRGPSFISSFVAEWNSRDVNQTILWGVTSNANVIYHSVTLQTQAEFTEVVDQAEWGTLYYAMPTVSDSNRFAYLTHGL